MPITASYGRVLSIEQSCGSRTACMKNLETIYFQVSAADTQLRLCVMYVFSVILNDSTAGRRDSFGLLQSVLMNVIGLYVSCKFGGNVKLLMYDEL